MYIIISIIDEKTAIIRKSPSEKRYSTISIDPSNNELIPQPAVTIMVESPKDAPANDFGMELTMRKMSSSEVASPTRSEISDTSAAQSPPPPPLPPRESTVINIDEPIDVNVPRDTSNIFYDYTNPSMHTEHEQSAPIIRRQQSPTTTTIITTAPTFDIDEDLDNDHSPVLVASTSVVPSNRDGDVEDSRSPHSNS